MKKQWFVLVPVLVMAFVVGTPRVEAQQKCMCTMIYKPVCGVNGQTYGNACVAKCSNIAVKCEGKCPCAKPCPVFKIAACPEGCVRTWTEKDGCKYPGPCKCTNPCATVRCAAPRICKVVAGQAKCECPPICKMYCQGGFEEQNGCPICKCRPVVPCGDKICKPGQKCVQVRCVRAPCPPVCM